MAVTLGVALPHYIAGPSSAPSDQLVSAARSAEAHGFTTGWISDHFFLPTERYGLPATETVALEAWTAMCAAAAATDTLRVGALVLCEAFRPAGILAKMAATFDVLSAGRLELGLGAGWHEEEYRRAGVSFGSPGERLAALEDAAVILRGMLAGSPFTHEGAHHTVRDAWNAPPPVQRPRPPLWIGGSGDRLLSLVARVGDGWNTAWRVNIDRYAERCAVLDRACESVGRDPATVRRSVGLYCLVGRDDADVARQLDRLRSDLPAGALADPAWFAEDALVGTVDQVLDTVGRFQALGVEHVILTPGPMPFSWPGEWWPDAVAELLMPALAGA